MSHTGRNKKLASFNCDSELWGEFMRRCQEQGTTATATLTRFIKLYLDDSLDNLDLALAKTKEVALGADTWDERVRAGVDEYLAERLSSHLDNWLSSHQGNWRELHSTVVALSEKLKDMEKCLKEDGSNSNTHTQAKSTSSKKERDFWFIQERARFLGVRLNADQMFRVDMFAADAYKERHGQPPSKKLYRNTQASVFPKTDVDILDPLIKGVAARG